MWFAADIPIGIHRSQTMTSWPPALHISRIACTWVGLGAPKLVPTSRASLE